MDASFEDWSLWEYNICEFRNGGTIDLEWFAIAKCKALCISAVIEFKRHDQ